MTTTPETASDPRVAMAEDRTTMAAYRTQLALDRTTLAWVRTTLTMGTFGFGLVGFFRSLRQASPSPETIRLHEGAIWFGRSLVILAIVCSVLAAMSHLRALRRMRRGQTPALSHWPLSITLALLIAASALVGLWSLMRL